MGLTIWCNAKFDAAAEQLLAEGTRDHRLVYAADRDTSVLATGRIDPALATADVAFGQPDAAQCLAHRGLKWIEITSAGYTRYDKTEFREAIRGRGGFFTNASGVFSEPCAQHVLAMMLALGRQLLASHQAQATDRAWRYTEHRRDSILLTGQTVLFLGYGAIGRRLAELLAPFRMTIYAVRRQTRSESGVRIVPEADLTRVLPLADHVVNILPDSESTRNFLNSRRLAWFKPGARLYNVGRGTTVDQRALMESLQTGRLGAAYLDVMEPEPLPPDHPLWTTPNCHITPHTAGGRRDQDDAIVRHFLGNLEAFTRGGAMVDRVI
jgi:phosphoglycerate dehydrogenase-like enzyme